MRGLSLEYAQKISKEEYDRLKAKIETGTDQHEPKTMPIKFTKKIEDGFYQFDFTDKFWGDEIIIRGESEQVGGFGDSNLKAGVNLLADLS